jgi:pheromone shutdown protein TraB
MVASVDLPAPKGSPPDTPPTRVLILGVSGASRASAGRAAALVRLARPDAVVLPLCRERAGLLVDPDSGDATVNASQATARWHCRRARLEGLPAADEAGARAQVAAALARLPPGYKGPAPPAPPVVPHFPPAEALLALVRTRPGVPVGVSDIEDDVRTLLATGLFARARPFCESAGPTDAPAFAAVARRANGGSSDGSSNGNDDGSRVALRFVPPLASTRFIVSPRTLPAVKSMTVRVDSSAQARAAELGVAQPALDAAGQRAAKACRRGKDDRASLGAYTTARAELLAMFGCGDAPGDSSDYVVAFSGVESGRPEALVRRRRAGGVDPPFLSGLEASAPGGEGLGIEAFKPVRQGLKLSRRMTLPPDAARRVIAEAAGTGAAAAAGAAGAAAPAAAAAEKEWSPATAPPRGSPVPGWAPSVPFREWTPEQADDAAAPAGVAQAAALIAATGPGGRTPLAGAPATLAALLSATFSALTSRAAATAGVGRGAAWRAALEAATEVGARAVVLADRPESATQRRLAETVAAGEGAALARLAAGAAALVGGAVAASTHVAGQLLLLSSGAGLSGAAADVAAASSGPAADAAALAVGAAAAAAALAPLAAPLADAWRFSRLASAEDVERDVALPPGAASIVGADLDERLALGGEDALLRLPGAWRPLVDERDAFLAAVTAATAAGVASGAPAFVADLVAPPASYAVGGGGGGGGGAGSEEAEVQEQEDDGERRQQQQQQQPPPEQKQLVWRFMAGGRAGGRPLDEGGAEGAAGRASLPGRGDGEYSWEQACAQQQQRPRCVVAVVGASHVRGMVRRWEWAAAQAVAADAGGVEAALAPLILGTDEEAGAVARAGDSGSSSR